MKTPKRHTNNRSYEDTFSAQSNGIVFNPLSDDQIKISELPEASGLDGGDLLPIVDISISGEALVTKKITLSNFIESAFNTSILPSGDNIKFTFSNDILYIYTSPTGYFEDLFVSNKTGAGVVVFNSSPALTGTPTAPTANSGTNTKQIANTEFVRTEIANLIDLAPGTLNTLNELAAAIANDPNYSVTIINQLATKANLSGASFSGTITSPTGDFVVLKRNGIDVSISGHAHSSNDIIDFDSSVSGLLPSITGVGYINSSFNNNLYSISATGLQPSGDYSLNGHSHNIVDISELQNALDAKQPSGIYASGTHTHTASNITDFDSSVSGLLPSVTGVGYINSSFNNNVYSISVTGLQPSGDYSLVGHSHFVSDISNFASGVNDLIPTVTNSGNNRILTSTGTSTGINAENNLTFDGNNLNVSGNLVAKSGSFLEGLYGITINPSIDNVNGTHYLNFKGSNTSGTIFASEDGEYLGFSGPWRFSGSHATIDSGNFASGLVISNQTANTIASFDDSKNVVSLSTGTYPSLTELSYVKNVTSNIQTQLNSKQPKYPTVVQLGNISGTINTNASLGDIFDLTLTASGTLANPTNPTDGQSVRWRISHNANNLILNFGDQFRIPSSATSPLSISSTSGSMDILGATYDSSRNKWDIVAFVPGY